MSEIQARCKFFGSQSSHLCSGEMEIQRASVDETENYVSLAHSDITARNSRYLYHKAIKAHVEPCTFIEFTEQREQLSFGELVLYQDRTVLKRICADKSKIRTTIQILEQALTLIHDNRVNDYMILVDKPCVGKRLHECRSSKYNDIDRSPQRSE